MEFELLSSFGGVAVANEQITQPPDSPAVSKACPSHDLGSRNRAIRLMAERGVPWPEIARTFGMSPAGVRRVCHDMPPRPPGRRVNPGHD